VVRLAKSLLLVIVLLFGVGINVVFTSPAMAAPSAKAFGELPKAWDAAISPQGDMLAMIVNVDGAYVVAVQNFADGQTMNKPWVLSLGKEVRPGFVKWVNDQRFVVSIRQNESYRGTPFTMSYLFTGDINQRTGKLLVVPDDMFRQFNDRVVDWLEDDPNHILMAYSDEAYDPFPDIKKVNVQTGKDQTVMRGRNLVEHWVTDDDGSPRIGFGRSEKGKDYMTVFNSDNGLWEDVSNYPGLEADMRIYGVTDNGTKAVIGDYQNKDTMGLYLYDLKQKAVVKTLYHNDDYDVSGVVLSKDGKKVIGARYTGDTPQVEMLDGYSTLLSQLRARFSDFTVDFVDQTDDGQTVIVKMSSPYDPGGFYSFKMGDDMPSRITAMYSQLQSKDMGEVIATRYRARDGEKIPAFITLPPTIKGKIENLPFIILPHGGPYARDEKRFDYFAQFFATRGYGVLQMNFRGSEGYGKTFKDAGRSNWIVMQQDVEDGTKWLYEKGYADPTKSCIAGWSYGGYAALMGAAKTSELYECAVSMAALTDIADAKRDLRKYRGGTAAAKDFFGEAMKNADVLRANTPTNLAGDMTIPILLAHGEDDQAVHYDQYLKMKKAMQRAGVEGTYLSFKDEDHYLSKQKNRETFFVAVEKFLLTINGRSPYMAK